MKVLTLIGTRPCEKLLNRKEMAFSGERENY